MLASITIQNFKCLRSVTMELSPLNVFIGTNDSGKTSIFQALELLDETTRKRIGPRSVANDPPADKLEGILEPDWVTGIKAGQRRTLRIFPESDSVFVGDVALENLVWMKDTSQAIRWTIDGQLSKEEPFTYSLSILPPSTERLTITITESLKLAGNERLHSNQTHILWDKDTVVQTQWGGMSAVGYLSFQDHLPERAKVLADLRQCLSSKRYSLSPSMLRLPSPLVQPGNAMRYDGFGLPSALDRILNSDRKRFSELEAEFCDRIGYISSIVLDTLLVPDSGQLRDAKRILFRLKDTKEIIPSSLASDGAMLLLAILTILYDETPPAALFFEEPENGLHFSRLRYVISLFEKISRGQLGPGKHIQIFLATHNPILVNYVRPDAVKIFKRDPQDSEAGTTVTPLHKIPNFDEWIEEFDPGELWYNLGEDELTREL